MYKIAKLSLRKGLILTKKGEKPTPLGVGWIA